MHILMKRYKIKLQKAIQTELV